MPHQAVHGLQIARAVALLALTSASSLAIAQDSTQRSFDALPAEVRQILADHMRRAVADGLAPGWRGAVGGRARVFERPDLEGPAYYEIEIKNRRSNAGYVVISAGQADFPVVQWNARGGRPSEYLVRLASENRRSISRFWRMGVHLAAEDAEGRLIGAIPGLTLPVSLGERAEKQARVLTDWPTQRREIAASLQKFYAFKRSDIAASWAALSSPSAAAGAPVCSVPDWDASPRYRQLSPNEPPNASWFASGCGATAWAMLIGWADRRAAAGDATWAPYWQLVTAGGTGDAFAPDATATRDMSPAIATLTKQLKDRLGTWGSPNTEGVTEPWRMDRVREYLDAVNLGGGRLRFWEDTTHGAQSERMAAFGQSRICRGQPAVLGIGALEHYALATAWRDSGGGEFYLNMGWGGVEGWYHEGVYYVGVFEPGVGGTLPPMSIVSATTSQCLDVRDWRAKDGAVVQQWGCAGTANQLWQARADLSIIGLDNRCLGAPGLVNAVGGEAHMDECRASDDSVGWRIGQWRLIANDGRCLTRESAGNRVSLWPCAEGGDAQQAWYGTSGGTLRAATGGHCLTNSSGTPQMQPCTPGVDADQRWLVTPGGRLRSLAAAAATVPSGKCLAPYRLPIPGAAETMALRDCSANARRQQWTIATTLQRQSGGCLVMPEGAPVGTAATTETCQSQRRQEWTLSFR